MQTILNDKNGLLSNIAVAKAKSRVDASFAKFGDHVKSVEITVLDINGPRGGIDKECRVLARMKRSNDIAVNVRDESVSKSVSHAIERAARAVGRWLDRRIQSSDNRLARVRLES